MRQINPCPTSQCRPVTRSLHDYLLLQQPPEQQTPGIKNYKKKVKGTKKGIKTNYASTLALKDKSFLSGLVSLSLPDCCELDIVSLRCLFIPTSSVTRLCSHFLLLWGVSSWFLGQLGPFSGWPCLPSPLGSLPYSQLGCFSPGVGSRAPWEGRPFPLSEPDPEHTARVEHVLPGQNQKRTRSRLCILSDARRNQISQGN